jgi:hypothetical protein
MLRLLMAGEYGDLTTEYRQNWRDLRRSRFYGSEARRVEAGFFAPLRMTGAARSRVDYGVIRVGREKHLSGLYRDDGAGCTGSRVDGCVIRREDVRAYVRSIRPVVKSMVRR